MNSRKWWNRDPKSYTRNIPIPRPRARALGREWVLGRHPRLGCHGVRPILAVVDITQGVVAPQEVEEERERVGLPQEQ